MGNKLTPQEKLLLRFKQFANKAGLFYIRFNAEGVPVELVPFSEGKRVEVLEDTGKASGEGLGGKPS